MSSVTGIINVFCLDLRINFWQITFQWHTPEFQIIEKKGAVT